MTDWRHVHNVVVPAAALSLEEVRENARHYLLEVAYRGEVLVGCTTVRPPTADQSTADESTATVIARVLASNVDGLRFAHKHGFAEVERHLLPGDSIPWITLRLT